MNVTSFYPVLTAQDVATTADFYRRTTARGLHRRSAAPRQQQHSNSTNDRDSPHGIPPDSETRR
ncbi:hypothetical protein [Micromonospora craniellae]|uniref:hypothetical protein n=1 Tax=Micromonospora craniellae TaxID=2294034 RepID=UPI0011C109EB|nr:hypothetical protein [Micromonospora craniellae]QOC93393.1 hypothetical protein ID554_06895 [Micromonospora craniellae]